MKDKAKGEQGKILLTGVAPAGLCSQQGIWTLQSKHVPPSALGCAGVGQGGLGCKDYISPAPVPSVWDAGHQHPGPAVDIGSCYEIIVQTRVLALHLAHKVQTQELASRPSLIVTRLWGWSYSSNWDVGFSLKTVSLRAGLKLKYAWENSEEI